MNKQIPLRITATQKVLPYLIAYQTRYGYSPTNHEIAAKFKYASTFMGNLLLRQLEDGGYIKIPRTKTGRAKSRAIQILKIK